MVDGPSATKIDKERLIEPVMQKLNLALPQGEEVAKAMKAGNIILRIDVPAYIRSAYKNRAVPDSISSDGRLDAQVHMQMFKGGSLDDLLSTFEKVMSKQGFGHSLKRVGTNGVLANLYEKTVAAGIEFQQPLGSLEFVAHPLNLIRLNLCTSCETEPQKIDERIKSIFTVLNALVAARYIEEGCLPESGVAVTIQDQTTLRLSASGLRLAEHLAELAPAILSHDMHGQPAGKGQSRRHESAPRHEDDGVFLPANVKKTVDDWLEYVKSRGAKLGVKDQRIRKSGSIIIIENDGDEVMDSELPATSKIIPPLLASGDAEILQEVLDYVRGVAPETVAIGLPKSPDEEHPYGVTREEVLNTAANLQLSIAKPGLIVWQGGPEHDELLKQVRQLFTFNVDAGMLSRADTVRILEKLLRESFGATEDNRVDPNISLPSVASALEGLSPRDLRLVVGHLFHQRQSQIGIVNRELGVLSTREPSSPLPALTGSDIIGYVHGSSVLRTKLVKALF